MSIAAWLLLTTCDTAWLLLTTCDTMGQWELCHPYVGPLYESNWTITAINGKIRWGLIFFVANCNDSPNGTIDQPHFNPEVSREHYASYMCNANDDSINLHNLLKSSLQLDKYKWP